MTHRNAPVHPAQDVRFALIAALGVRSERTHTLQEVLRCRAHTPVTAGTQQTQWIHMSSRHVQSDPMRAEDDLQSGTWRTARRSRACAGIPAAWHTPASVPYILPGGRAGTTHVLWGRRRGHTSCEACSNRECQRCSTLGTWQLLRCYLSVYQHDGRTQRPCSPCST